MAELQYFIFLSLNGDELLTVETQWFDKFNQDEDRLLINHAFEIREVAESFAAHAEVCLRAMTLPYQAAFLALRETFRFLSNH